MKGSSLALSKVLAPDSDKRREGETVKSQNTKRSWHPLPGRSSAANANADDGPAQRQRRRKTVSWYQLGIDLARCLPRFGNVSTAVVTAAASAEAEALIRAITIAGSNLHKFQTLAGQLDRISDVATEAKFWPRTRVALGGK